MALKKSNTKDKALSFMRVLLHGESGAGKTTSLGTLPEECTVVAAAERGLLPLRNKNFEVIVIETWQDVQELYRMFREPYHIGGDEKRPAKVLAIDSISEISELCKEQILMVDRKSLMKERTNDKSDKPKGIYDDQMSQEDWGLYRTRMQALISAFCHLPLHVIFTGLSQWTEDKRTGTLHITPNLNGKIAMECPAFFDLLLYMKSDAQGQRVWQTFNDGQVLAKDASGALDQFEAPKWPGVFKKILNGSTNETGKDGVK